MLKVINHKTVQNGDDDADGHDDADGYDDAYGDDDAIDLVQQNLYLCWALT